MTYRTKMVLRLAVPSVAVFIASMTVAYSVASSLLPTMGVQHIVPHVGDAVALGTGIVFLFIYGFQMLKYWR